MKTPQVQAQSLKASVVFCLFFMTTLSAAASGPRTPNTQHVPGNLSLTTTMSNTHVLLPGSGEVQLAIDVHATADASSKRLPMNLALVIDRSGSMRGAKMTRTIQAAMHLVRQLNRKDTLAIVSYSDDVRVDLPARRVNRATKRAAMAAIERIAAGGSTNLSGGLMRGQSEVQRNLRSGQVNRVILMSDGLANRGITNVQQLSQQVQQVAQRGISVTTMGVGTDYNEDLMTAVADHASGNYYFIESADAIAGVFSQELKKMFATVAQAAVLKIQLEDGVDLQKVHGYTYRRKRDTVSIPLAEMFAEQKRSILISLKVNTGGEGKTRLATVDLSYEDVSSYNRKITASMDLSVQVTRDEMLVKNGLDKSVQERIEEVKVAEVMTEAADLLKRGKHKDAQKIIRAQRMKSAARSSSLGGSGRIDNQVRQLEALDDAFGRAEAEPAATGAMVKKTKAAARKQSR